ncbi:hypothetical protein [Celeribacter indicus]|uniref:Excalibur calcium-binding domain-containing protein n=1 Tax=Celeribacter indicus TaxID=1208324 RepID=A0A0B5DRS4_9RHOB|nr:hypothetical protein [Celeribacter indicus]AJE46228.1 hypothetical protein P73_1513 [Celeribacter indicus]SDW50524.1 hypothetical protein SAMN05443573_10461 [Celeribacter indicus]
MRRASIALMSLAVLAACEPPVPDSGTGVGFGSYADYQAEREAQLIANGEGQGVPGAPMGAAPASRLNTQQISEEALSAIDASQGAVGAPTPTVASRPQASNVTPGPAVSNAMGISAENNFDAVSAERSIEEDAARVAANRQAYVTIQPTVVPNRPVSDAGTIVEFALSTTNTVGQPIYSRLIPGAASRAARNCAKYPSPDLAQEDFLRSGGPQRNAKGLDPDGDGFACSWDPAPFRLAAQNRR